MQEVTGTFNTAKVFTDNLAESAFLQIETLCNQEFAANCKIRIMPDVHAGAGCTIGTTMTITDKVVPNLVGVDIGCGMETIQFSCKRLELEKLDKLIYEKIPSGMNIRKSLHPYNKDIDLTSLRCRTFVDLERAGKSIGTLGGGNHFIEVNKEENGAYYLVIHSGSRHLGLEVAEYYQKEGYKRLNHINQESLSQLIAEYKEQGRDKEISSAIKQLKKQVLSDIPFALAYVSDDLFEDYIHDMKIVQQFAVLNRKAMAYEIIKGMKLRVEDEFTTIHNYIDTDEMILRKGAVSAKAGEKLLIPINMRDGSLICIGKGNEDWNFSAPHGAGRLFSRMVAKNTFTVSQFKKEMEGIFSSSIHASTLDECPMAYKSMDEIISNIKPTADILSIIKPIYNFKA